MKPGLFVGWKLAPGKKWTGDYYVVDFQQVVAHLHDGRVVGEQTIKEVFCEELSLASQKPFVFTAREAFDQQMRQIPDDLEVPLPYYEPQQQIVLTLPQKEK